MPPVEGEEEESGVPSLPGLGQQSTPLVRTPFPDDASARGSLVEGFPRPLRPLAGSRVQTSSVSQDGTRLQVALEAVTSAGADRVLLRYRTRFARLGLVEESVRAVDGAEASGFSRGRSSVVVTARRGPGSTTYTVYGVLRADG